MTVWFPPSGKTCGQRLTCVSLVFGGDEKNCGADPARVSGEKFLRSAKEPSEKALTEKSADPAAPPPAPPSRGRSADRDMGAALRSIYQRTIDETIPDDLMSLLGKLD